VIEASESGSVAVLTERAGTVGLEDVEGEASHAGEDAGVGSDARAIFAHGDVAAVVGCRLDGPVRADCLGGASGGDRCVRDVERGLGGVAQQPGLGIAGEDLARNTDDSGDVGMPVAIGQFAGGIEDGDSAALVAVATLIVAVGRPERHSGDGDVLDLLEKGRLVVFDLDDQGDVGFGGNFEMFFWQCIASSVTMAPSRTPSSANSVCAAGISLDFSATSMWARTRAVSVANALNI
jgi:hypothetical protein